MENEVRDKKTHWDRVYEKSETDSLGWYEDYPAPSLNLIQQCNLDKKARILNIGAGAEKCSGLPVYRYSSESLQEKMAENFEMLDAFDYSYTMPSGNTREYVYTLFRK